MAARKKSSKKKSARKTAAPKKKSSARKKKSTPWEQPAPAHDSHTKLSEPQKKKAKQRARRAGRPYPNLVDNMTVTKEAKASSPRKKAKKTAPQKRKRSS